MPWTRVYCGIAVKEAVDSREMIHEHGGNPTRSWLAWRRVSTTFGTISYFLLEHY